ncbi:UNVERIFIED_CONTAM: hypothetical protein Q9R58_27380 [Methylobacteriaceae bacterium AG10]|nr:hypothetical protein [Methylobacteriaceae bacterium AG10]
MRKLLRHVTVRVERETAEALHAVMASQDRTASDYLRAAIRSAVASNDGAPPPASAGSSLSAAA